MKKVKLLQKTILIFMAVLTLLGIAPTIQAMPLPLLDFQGSITAVVNASNEVQSITNSVFVTQYLDLSGVAHSFALDSDPILGQPVVGAMPSGITYDWVNDILTVDPTASALFQIGTATSPYLVATVTNVEVKKVRERDYRINGLLTNQTLYHTSDSLFMDQYEQAIGTLGLGQLMTWDLIFEYPSSNNGNTTYFANVSGKVAPVPEPATVLLLGSGLVGLGFFRRKKHDA